LYTRFCHYESSRPHSSTMDDKQKFEELKRMYNGKELSECFANLHMTFDKEIQKVNHEMARISEKVNVLDSNAQLVNDDLQNIHNTIVPNLEDKFLMRLKSD